MKTKIQEQFSKMLFGMSKKQIFRAAAILAFAMSSQNAQSQGFLGRLKDKVNNAATLSSASSEPVPNEKEALKDIENKDLDSKYFTKDKYDISGIYISSKAFGLLNDNDRVVKSFRKFLIEFDDKELTFQLSSRHTDNQYTAFKYIMNDDVSRKLVGKNIFMKFVESSNNGFSRSTFFSDNLFQFGKSQLWKFDLNNVNLTMLEPGVFVFAPSTGLKLVGKCGEARFLNNDDDEYKFHPFNLLYKPGKDVSKWTGEAIKKKLFELQLEHCNMDLNTVAGAMLPRPGNAASSPIFAEPKSKIMSVFKAHLSGDGMSHFIPTYAYVHFDNASYSDYIIPHPVTGVKVVAGRLVDFIVVAKNTTPGGGSSDYRKVAKGKNVFFHVNLLQLVKDKQYNTQNYEPKWSVYNYSSQSEIDEKENPLKYKSN